MNERDEMKKRKNFTILPSISFLFQVFNSTTTSSSKSKRRDNVRQSSHTSNTGKSCWLMFDGWDGRWDGWWYLSLPLSYHHLIIISSHLSQSTISSHQPSNHLIIKIGSTSSTNEFGSGEKKRLWDGRW